MKSIMLSIRDFIRKICLRRYSVDTRFRHQQMDLAKFVTKKFADGSVEVLLNGRYQFRVWDFQPELKKYWEIFHGGSVRQK